MAKKQKALKKIQITMDEGSWNWLSATDESLADAVQDAVEEGGQPREIREYIVDQYARDRLALICQAAARHILRGQE